MGLLFKHGALSSTHQNWAQNEIDKYPYVVLLSQRLTFDWENANLSIHESIGEDCMGGSYVKRSHMFSCFECVAGELYFFLDKGDYEKVCALDIVIDKQPFVTYIP